MSDVLALGRRAAESRMTSRCTIRRRGGTTKDGNGFTVPAWTAVATATPFRLGGSNTGSAGSRTVRIGDVEAQVAVRVGHLPVSTPALSDGDLIEITAGENAGLVLRIVEATGQDQATARRLPVVEVSRPEEWS